MSEENGTLKDLEGYIKRHFQEDILQVELSQGALIVTVEPEKIVLVSRRLRDNPDCLFKCCLDICGVDWPEQEKRFEVVYNLLSLKHARRIRLKVCVSEEGVVPSVNSVWPSAGWYEREVWDMYGVLFSNHPDLRRILTDYGFNGHPLRKDFPLTGHVEVSYDEKLKRVVYAPVKLMQDFRNFDFLSPWEGDTPIPLPGDEKANDGALGKKEGA